MQGGVFQNISQHLLPVSLNDDGATAAERAFCSRTQASRGPVAFCSPGKSSSPLPLRIAAGHRALSHQNMVIPQGPSPLFLFSSALLPLF